MLDLATNAILSTSKIAICQVAIKKANKVVAWLYNRCRSNVSFQQGDLVLLHTKHLCPDQPSCKLSNPLAGPFKIDATISDHAYRLLLPPSWKVHPVFHIQMLELYPDNTRKSSDTPQSNTLRDDYEDFKIEGIQDSQWRASRLQYLIKWVGYLASWMLAEDVNQAEELLTTFHHNHPTKPRPHHWA